MKPRTITKQELALLYFPNSAPRTAVNHLRQWIIRCTPLREALEQAHSRPADKYFTTRQMSLIFQFLGEP